MARPPRIEFEGAVYHVTARGNERGLIFRSDKDRKRFLETLEEMRLRFGVIVHCFCLMPNHFHLVLETPSANLSQAMGWLQTTYTIRFNLKHRRSGHLFQGRYKAHLVQADAYAMQLVRYIHLNPVRPRNKSELIPRASMEKLERYEWSSHPDYSGRCRERVVDVATDWLCFWHGQKGKARGEYRRFIKAAFGEELPSPWQELKGGLVLGDEGLWRKAKEFIGGKGAKESVQWTSRERSKTTGEKLIKWASEESDERMKIWIRSELGGERNVALAQEFGYSDGSGVHRVVQRLKKAAETDKQMKARMNRLRKKLESSRWQ